MTIDLHVRSAPFALEQAGDAEYYELMGRTVALWGRFEAAFVEDVGVLALNNTAARKLLVSRRLGFKSLMGAYRSCFDLVPELRNFSKQADAFAMHAISVSDSRNMLAHGSFWGFVERDPHVAKFRKLQLKEEGVWKEQATLSADVLRGLISDIDALNLSLLALTSAYSTQLWPAKSDKLKG